MMLESSTSRGKVIEIWNLGRPSRSEFFPTDQRSLPLDERAQEIVPSEGHQSLVRSRTDTSKSGRNAAAQCARFKRPVVVNNGGTTNSRGNTRQWRGRDDAE